MYETIAVRTDGPVTAVELNRPEVRNAFDAGMIGELTTEFTRLAADAGTRVVVLRGAGKSFSAGADVNYMRASLDASPEDNLADARRMSDMFAAIENVPKPVICRVHGAALGGGMGLMAACDVVVAADNAVFGFTEAKLGIVPAVISRVVVPKIGPSWARSLFLTAERFDAAVACRIGLAHWVAPAAELDAMIEAKVSELLTSGPAALAAAKQLVRNVSALPPDQVRDYTAQVIATLRAGPEGQEGLHAFLDKRRPTWHPQT